MNESPLISVIIPTYNRVSYILETIDSIRSQTYTNWECLVIDDGSTDNTKEVLKEIIIYDKRFRYLHIQNSGPSKAREIGIINVAGDFIQFLDSDDLITPTRFEKCINEIKGNDFIVTNFNRFKSKTELFLPPYCVLSQELLNLNSIVLEWDKSFTIPIHCGFFRANIFKKVTMHTSLQMYEDWLMWIDIFLNEFNGKFLNECLAHYRFSHQSLSFELEKRTKIVAKAYWIIYNKIPRDLRADFFKIIVDRLCEQLAEAYSNNLELPVKSNCFPNSAVHRLKRFLTKIK